MMTAHSCRHPCSAAATTGAVTPTSQGTSVALSGHGNTAVVGGLGDSSGLGAAWIFLAPPAAHDFNGDGKSDIAWRDNSGNAAVWLGNVAI